jgi:hypothetical protein
MNRTTRLSLIAVMLLATSALGIIGYKSMYPDLPPPEPKSEPKIVRRVPIRPMPAKPKEPIANPYYIKLRDNLAQHEQRCLELGRIIASESEKHAQECWSLVRVEKDYVGNYEPKQVQP